MKQLKREVLEAISKINLRRKCHVERSRNIYFQNSNRPFGLRPSERCPSGRAQGDKEIFLRWLLLSFSFILNCDAQNNEWTWVKGNNSVSSNGSYGTMGISGSSNEPPARYEPAEWKDLQGNFWIYGGYRPGGNITYSDLWKYDPTTNQWTWIKGNPSNNVYPVHGTKGVANINNTPGGRENAAATWVDNAGNLWLFGGQGYLMYGSLNDLWKYDIATNMWTWVKGDNFVDQPGIYGTKGVAAPANNPGSRFETSCTWTDNNGNLWLFGGGGYDVNGNYGMLNDLWKYNTGTNQWTWVAGSNLANQTAVYGTRGVAAPTNDPGGRYVFASWKDLNGNLWMFGGKNAASNMLNDLWKYDITANMWIWMHGANTPNHAGVYGTKCTPHVANMPPARKECRARWTDDCGNFWLFGGRGKNPPLDKFDDLWRYNPVTNEWTWISGNNVPNQPGIYGTQGQSAAANKPGARYGSVGWINNDGIWLWGGFDFNNGHYNDLWKYTPDKPTAVFTPTPSSGCAPLNVNFQNNSRINCSDISSYEWDFGDPMLGSNNTATISNPAHTYNNPGTYQVRLIVSNCQGIKDTAVQTVTVSSITANITNKVDASCGMANGSATVSASNGMMPYTYLWQPGSQTGVTASGLAGGTYTVQVNDVFGCLATTTVVINQPSLIQVAVNSLNNVKCKGGNNGYVSVSATGGNGGYTYQWSGGQSGSSVSNLSASTYTVLVTDAAGCTATTSITITEPPLLQAFIPVINNTLCNGNANGTASAAGLGGTPNYSYQWSNGNTAQNISGLAAGTYSVIITDANGCSAQISTVITEPAPVQIIPPANVVTCIGQSVSLSASAIGGYGGYTFTWNPGNIQGNQIIISPSGNTTYTIYASDVNGCNATPQSVTVTVGSNPITLNTASGISICVGASAVLSATASGGNGQYTFNWQPGNLTGTPINVSPTLSTTYTVSVSDNCGNPGDTSAITLQVNSLPEINITASDTSGCPILCVNFSNPVPSASATWNWSFGDGSVSFMKNPTHCFNAPGYYTISLNITDINGCSNASSNNNFIHVYNSPSAAFTLNPNSLSILNPTVYFTNQSNGSISWLWNFGDENNTTSSLKNPQINYNDTGKYTISLIAFNEYGCTDTAYHFVLVENDIIFYLPNTFTPNNDNRNDFFRLSGTGYEGENPELIIFDRWGNQLFYTSTPGIGWDGKVKGGTETAQQDTYIWRLILTDKTGNKKEFTGHVNLLR